tara:strand:- start:184 stop:480 length:297 start_codon:yes stop_codon:yes gene_type:complete
MTKDSRNKIELCFNSVEKIVSLRDALTRAVTNISINLEWAIGRLEDNQLIDRAENDNVELKEGLMNLDSTDVEFINQQYTDALWETMQILLPHYKTNK